MCHEVLHIATYCEIARGKYFPGLARYINADEYYNLVFEANTVRVAILPSDTDIINYIENNDFISLGYKSRKDYTIDYNRLPDQKYEIVIRPNKIYNLNDAIDIPQYETPKSISFVEFMGDEFERIKLRAEWVLDFSADGNALALYASRQIQKAKKLFSDAKRELREIQSGNNRDNIYILFVLNLFVVRTIVFHQELFHPYLKNETETKERMLYEIFQELSFRKVFKLYRHCLAIYPAMLRKSFIEKPNVSEGQFPTIFTNTSETFSETAKNKENKASPQYKPIKLNGQINVLVDVFVQMLEKYNTPEGPFIETSRENIEAFLVANFVDRNNKPLSAYTIHTLLKPYRIDKHIKLDNPKRIDLTGFFESGD